MLKFEKFQTPLSGNLPYFDQLSAIDNDLANYVADAYPSYDVKTNGQAAWDDYEAKNPAIISTADLTKNAIDNLEAIPFRTLLEELGMPFEDNAIYTASDIAASTDETELLANVMANIYQFGNLSQAVFVTMPYLKKFSQQDMDKFSDATQQFISDLTVSTEPFEMVTFPTNEMMDGFELLELIEKQQSTLSSSIVLHPIIQDLNIIFINSTNINGMSVKQISDRLNQLSKIRQAINITKLKDIIASPQVDRNIDAQAGMNRDKDGDITRGERIKATQIKKLSSTKKVAALIQRDIKKRSTSQRTNNVTKKVKKTYNKPNRREPDNDFKPGKTKYNVYRPNLHLYLDTSGSMSMDQYRSGIMAAIQIAKELGTDIFLSSFSDTLAEPVLLDKINSQRPSVLLKKALRVPVIQGGTDFENVYNAIAARAAYAAKKGRAPEYAILLSDMEFWFSGGYHIPKEAQKTLHLMVSDYDDGEDFKTSAYNAGMTQIDKLLYKI